MSGGLIQLVAYGPQDLFLTSDPQITFFKVVYRRYTNFSTEVIKQDFLHKPDFGKRITCDISRSGDLIGRMDLVVILPSVPKFLDANNNVDVISKFAWIQRIGYGIIKSIEIEIGNELIDRQYGDWMNIWHELTVIRNKNISKILGDVKELTNFTNGKNTYKLFIPLRFWFNRYIGLALPIISLQLSHVKLNLEINEIDNCYIVAPTQYIDIDNDFVNFDYLEFIEQNVDGVVSLARFVYFDIALRRMYIWRYSDNGFLSGTTTTPALKNSDGSYNSAYTKYLITGLTTRFQAMPLINAVEKVYTNNTFDPSKLSLRDAFLLVEFIFLDDEERVRFSQTKHEYLIEQILYNDVKIIDGVNQSFKIGFTHLCKELYWVTQLTQALNTRINDVFNYTDSLIKDQYNQTIGKNIITQETIIFNGKPRLSLRDSKYFHEIQPYQNHTHNPVQGINVYSFSMYPELFQPACVANFNQIDNIQLSIAVTPEINFNNTAQLRIYGMVNNLLRIISGISGLVFSNDYQN